MDTSPTITTIQVLQRLLAESPHVVLFVTACLSVLFTILALIAGALLAYKTGWLSPSLLYHEDRRRRLPRTVIVIRHGESEANASPDLWKTIPDNLLGLTPQGREQARTVGQRVEAILKQQNCQRVHLVISPFERTLQTAHHLRQAFEPRIVRTEIESRIREQEVGNLQGDEFADYRRQQKKVGRFWYRFPTGESGADVLDRVKSWWHESVLTVNQRAGYDPVDAMIVVTHGLTIRFILTQLFGWSPTTFHSVWNAGNCDMYVLQKDLKFPGLSPYGLSEELGDVPKSSIDVSVTLRNGQKHLLRLDDYLVLPPPRTKQTKLVRKRLCKQYPQLLKDPKEIREILFMPFIENGIIRGRSTSGSMSRRMQRTQAAKDGGGVAGFVSESSSSSSSSSSDSEDDEMVVDETNDAMNGSIRMHFDEEDDCEDDEDVDQPDIKVAKREQSMRYPCCVTKSLQEMFKHE